MSILQIPCSQEAGHQALLISCLSFVRPSHTPRLVLYSSLNRMWEMGTRLFSKLILTTAEWEHRDLGSIPVGGDYLYFLAFSETTCSFRIGAWNLGSVAFN